MSQKSGTAKPSSERIVKDIRRATRNCINLPAAAYFGGGGAAEHL
jgi:hypothetical protein